MNSTTKVGKAIIRFLNKQKPYFEIFTDNVFFCNLQVYFEQTGTSKEENVSGRL